MTSENKNCDAVGCLETLENEVQIAGAMIEAARVILQAQEAGKIDADAFPARAPHRTDPIHAILLEAECKLSDSMKEIGELNGQLSRLKRRRMENSDHQEGRGDVE